MTIEQVINIHDLRAVPYFKVNPGQRIRFHSEDFDQKNWGSLKRIIYDTFRDDQKISCTFIIGHVVNDRKTIYHRIGLDKYFTINNWIEKTIYEEDRDETIIFARVDGIRKSEIYKFARAITSSFTWEVEITFHSQHYMVYVNGDVLDIVALEDNYIDRIKKNIPKWLVYEQEEQDYDSYHDS